MLRITDDRKRELTFGRAPQRIVSLVPSDTLSVADLGARGALVACTDYCELPTDVVAGLPRIGGTKNPRLDAIMALEPDLILANQEENTRSDLEKLAAAGFRVFVAFPKRVADGLAHLARLARILYVDREPAVRALLKAGYDAMQHAERARLEAPPVSVFCPIWMDPLMTINGETFISDMLRLGGADNVFFDRDRRYPLAADLSPVGAGGARLITKPTERDVRYPRITRDELVARDPDLILLPSEPHPFSEEDARIFAALPSPAGKARRVVFCDGKDLCWSGSRSVTAIDRIRALVRNEGEGVSARLGESMQSAR